MDENLKKSTLAILVAIPFFFGQETEFLVLWGVFSLYLTRTLISLFPENFV